MRYERLSEKSLEDIEHAARITRSEPLLPVKRNYRPEKKHSGLKKLLYVGLVAAALHIGAAHSEKIREYERNAWNYVSSFFVDSAKEAYVQNK